MNCVEDKLYGQLKTVREDVRTGKSGVEIGLFELIDVFIEYMEYINRKEKTEVKHGSNTCSEEKVL